MNGGQYCDMDRQRAISNPSPEFHIVITIAVSGSFSTFGGVSGTAGVAIGLGSDGIKAPSTFASGSVNASSPGTGVGISLGAITGTSDPSVLTGNSSTTGFSITGPTEIPGLGVYGGFDLTGYASGNTGYNINFGITPLAFPKTEFHQSIPVTTGTTVCPLQGK